MAIDEESTTQTGFDVRLRRELRLRRDFGVSSVERSDFGELSRVVESSNAQPNGEAVSSDLSVLDATCGAAPGLAKRKRRELPELPD